MWVYPLNRIYIYIYEVNALSFIALVFVYRNTSQHQEQQHCWWMSDIRRWQQLEPAVDSTSTSDVWRPAGTHGTWRRRWKGWYSCCWTPEPRWSGSTSLKSRGDSRENRERPGYYLVCNRRWIRNRSPMTSPVHFARLCSWPNYQRDLPKSNKLL